MVLASINDTEYDLWKKLVNNSAEMTPTPPVPPQNGFLLLNSGDFVLLNSGDLIELLYHG